MSIPAPPVYVTGIASDPMHGNAPIYVTPTLTSGGHVSVATTAAGTTFAALPSQSCRQLTISNSTGVTIEVQQGGTGVALPVFSGTYFTFFWNHNRICPGRAPVGPIHHARHRYRALGILMRSLGLAGQRQYRGCPLSAPILDFDLTAAALDPAITFTRASARTYFDAGGALQLAPANVWPVEYDRDTGAVLGRSVWAQSTNLVANSLGNFIAPRATEPTVVAATDQGSIYAPATVLKITGVATGSSNDSNAGNFTVSTTSGQAYTVSLWVYVPVGQTGYGTLYLGADYAASKITLDTLTKGRWQRVTGTFTATATSSICLFRAMGGFTFYATCPQVQSFTLTPYIPTSGAVATCAADIATAPFALPQNGDALLYAEYLIPPRTTLDRSRYAANLYPPSGTARMGIRVDTSNSSVTTGTAFNSVGGSIVTGGLTCQYGSITKAACVTSGDAGSIALAVGGVPSTPGRGMAVDSLTRLCIGAINGDTFASLDGYVRRVKLYARSGSIEEIQGMTS